MKRCFSAALILALLTATCPSPALAEEAEVVSYDVDAVVALADYAGDTGLTVEGEAPAIGEAVPAEDEAALPAEAEQIPAPEESGPWTEEADPQADDGAFGAEAFPEEYSEDEAVLAPDLSLTDTADETEGPAQIAALPATGIQFDCKSISIGLQETFKGLTVTALPAGSALPALSWRSGNEKVVSVDPATGAITGVGKGSASVYAATANGQEIECTVTVKKAPTKLTLKSTKLTLGMGLTARLQPSVSSGAASAALSYTTSKASVATVDDSGLITAVGKGTAKITVKTYNGKKAACKVTVPEAPASIRLPCESISIAVNQSFPLTAKVLAANGSAMQCAVTYSINAGSRDAGCVTLDAKTGTVTGVRKGQAVISAATPNGLIAMCTVNVAPAPQSVNLNMSSVTIGVKEICSRLKAEAVAPAGETTCASAVTWSTSNKKVATVDAYTGVVTGVGKGSCTITAKTANGKTDKCKLTVRKAPGKIAKLWPMKGQLTVGDINQYKVTLPKGTGGSVTFTSSNPAIATVGYESGIVTALKDGTVTVTATTYNGHTKKATLTVRAANNGAQEETPENKTGTTNADKLEYVISIAQSKLGKPYVYGSFGPDSFDCSGFTTYCFRQINIELKHSAYTQGYDTTFAQVGLSQLKRGDLVYFNTVNDNDLSDHAGLYLGNGKFIHASSSGGKVIISTLASGYYSRVFSWGRRVLN